MTIQEINKKIIEFSKERLIKMGKIPSGLFNYYVGRIKQNAIINYSDTFLIKHILKNYNLKTRINEPCSGIGQLSHCLSLFGYSVTNTDGDDKRFKCNEELGKYLESTAKTYKMNFRNFDYSNTDLIICNNASGSSGIDLKKDIEFFKDKILKGIEIILSLSSWGMKNHNLIGNYFNYLLLDYEFIKIGTIK